MKANLNALQTLVTKKSNQIILKKEDSDYSYSVGQFQFIATKQPKCGNEKGGYFVECQKWINNSMHQQSVDLGIYNIVSLKEVKQIIFCFLFSESVEAAAKKVYNN